MMREQCLIMGGLILMLSTGYLCLPSRRDLFDFDCNKDLNCTEDVKPVCGSDGETYTNICHLQVEHQRQNCVVGNFNPIVVVKDGNCTEDGNDVNVDDVINRSILY